MLKKQGKATVLVIDDDDLYCQTLCDILTDAGYRTLGAQNGAEGLRAFATTDVDLVVCDLLMPEKEGIETIIELRRSKPTARIIAVSGGSMGQTGMHLQAARQLGADAALEKPIRSAELLSVTAKLLAGSD